MSYYASQRGYISLFLFVCFVLIRKGAQIKKADVDFSRKVTFCIIGLVLIHSFIYSEWTEIISYDACL